MKKQSKIKVFFFSIGISNKTIAELLGVSLTTVNYKLNGKIKFNIEEIQKLMDKFKNAGLTLEHFGLKI